MSGFAKLPSELTDEIFYRVSPTDLLNISLTCRVLYEKSISSINRFLKISVLPSTSINETRAKKLFSKAFTNVSPEYLREIEVGSVLKKEVNIRNLDPRHIYVASKIKGCKESSGGDIDSGVIFNLHLRDLLSRLPPKQLKKFSCFFPHTTKEPSDDRFFEPKTLSAIFSPGNMLTTLNVSFSHSLSSDCSVFYLPHLISFTFRAEDFTTYYHSIFSVLFSCQKTLRELYCNNERHKSSGRVAPERSHEILFYMDHGFAQWKGCTKCGQDNPPSTPSKRRIRLTELRVWRIDGLSHMMTEIFGPYNLVQGSRLTDVEVAIGSLAFVKLITSEGGTLQLERLLEYANGTQILPDSQGLETYFRYTKELVKVTLNFHKNLGFGWLEALKGCSETLKELHLSSVYGNMVLTEDELEGLGRSLQKLEMLTISSDRDLPICIMNSEVFPRLKYFGNRAYSNFDPGTKNRLEDFMGVNNEETSLSTSLRLICFRLPGQNYLIERSYGANGRMEVSIHNVEDFKVPEILGGLGGAPRFG
ncbi:uncharacterized protein DFL_005806 [Arthrobotrys flagrans]|uniref:F-box domain-containing protein n=1 Tax=Arthrobotrys flagrans TaxID=97331 RepID=A0A436ZYG5_ARTFL|nr:hypothetical protein DFL_005806 [Arthrobotrys flagrans]